MAATCFMLDVAINNIIKSQSIKKQNIEMNSNYEINWIVTLYFYNRIIFFSFNL